MDHDFPSASQGKLIPHGIHDATLNEGTIHLNTSELCCVSISLCWQRHGSRHYSKTLRI
ncbi:ISAzo13-like element transposase-related protein [Methylomonas sp. LL1]|uniref:ISAzo13-like element transposase-related protein n=1 Tax=Methylomonas sp. LL1 TaxID=2785785 RepID=UPI003FA57346